MVKSPVSLRVMSSNSKDPSKFTFSRPVYAGPFSYVLRCITVNAIRQLEFSPTPLYHIKALVLSGLLRIFRITSFPSGALVDTIVSWEVEGGLQKIKSETRKEERNWSLFKSMHGDGEMRPWVLSISPAPSRLVCVCVLWSRSATWPPLCQHF